MPIAKKILLLSCASVAFASFTASANDEIEKITQALKSGTPYVDVRYRYEFVDQDNIADEAKASTIRTRLGYKTGDYYGFRAALELQNVSAIGAENYNDGGGTISKTGVPVVADPVENELNQAYIEYVGLPDTTIKYGRHTLNRGNQRFIGSVGWRQNNQNHDGVAISNRSIPDTELFYGYTYNVNRIFGSEDILGDFSTQLHMADARYNGLGFVELMGYGYWLDIDTPTSQRANASKTYGLNATGKYELHERIQLLYLGEYAKQSDHGENTTDYDADYWRVEGGLSAYGLTVKVGYEELGSDDGVAAFRTPLATLHKFNGWADQFLVTPANGLQDTYVKANYVFSDIHEIIDDTKIAGAYHTFSQDNGSADYGEEWNLDISREFLEHYMVGVVYANYDSTGLGSQATSDVEKIILSVGAKF